MKKLSIIAVALIAAGIAVMDLPFTILMVASGITTLYLLEQRRRYLIELRSSESDSGKRRAA